MAASSDYFNTRPALRTRPPPTVQGPGDTPASPRTPRTPLLGRSISAQFGSPGSFRTEQEEHIVYELGARHLSAGFAGEGRPRCVLKFHPDGGRRVGDYRAWEPNHEQKQRVNGADDADWGSGHELYRVDLRALDLALVRDKLERAVRDVHTDCLQLDQKPRKAVLALPSLLPTPLVEVALNVLFHHYAQPPSVLILTTPILACVGAGLRSALVVDVGWEETVVTAVGEYKEIHQRRSARAGKMLTREMAKMLAEETAQTQVGADKTKVPFPLAEEVTERTAWCRQQAQTPNKDDSSTSITIPFSTSESPSHITVPFARLSDPAEIVFFSTSSAAVPDDDDLFLHTLVYRVLLAIPLDIRAVCISRLVIAGGVSQLPGLKVRLLRELTTLVETRGWDPVHSYGSARKPARTSLTLQERSSHATLRPDQPSTLPHSDPPPPSQRAHDDLKDPVTLKAEREATKTKAGPDAVRGVVRGVETLGPWAGASLVASLRVKGVHEVERDEFIKHGFRDGGAVI